MGLVHDARNFYLDGLRSGNQVLVLVLVLRLLRLVRVAALALELAPDGAGALLPLSLIHI